MIDFKKTLNTLKFSIKFDEDLPRQFLKRVFKDAVVNATHVQEQIKLATGATIKVTKVNSNETAIAMIGTSLALLQKHSALMSSKQGKKVELMCKKSLEKDFGLTIKESELMINGINEYIEAYNESWSMKTNPFNRPAGILLMNFTGKEVDKVFQKDNPELIDPLIHQMIMDMFMLMIIEPMKVFKQ